MLSSELNKAPKTCAERVREFRARKVLLKQQSKQQQESNAIVEIAAEDFRSAGPSEDNQVPVLSSKKQAKTCAERVREYRARKALLKQQNYSNSTLSGEKPFLSRRVSKNSFDLDLNPSAPLGKYQCFLCPLNFAEKNYLSKHLMKHFNRRRPFMCPVCEKTFRKMDNLKTHINCCADIKSYQCEQCDEAFTTSSKLCQHRRGTHSGMSPYKCAKCDYKTFEQRDINKHNEIKHMDDRPFKCNYCSFAAKSQKYLTTHEKFHKVGKAYKCDVCYSRFLRPQTLKVHRKKHFLEGSTVNRCTFCRSEFGFPDALRKHVENIHRDEIVK